MEQLAELTSAWIIILAYQVISDQTANVFTFMLPAWVRVLLSTANCVNGRSISRFWKQELQM